MLKAWKENCSGNGGLPPDDIVPTEYEEMLIDFVGKEATFGIANVVPSSVYSSYKFTPTSRREFHSDERENKPHYQSFIECDTSKW